MNPPGVGGDATLALAVLWSLTGVAFIFVLLRLYTRLRLLDSYGIDDHCYNAAFVILLVYDVLIQLSSHYGFGRDITTLDDDTAARAILYEIIGQTVLVVGTEVSKLSLSFFLLRIVTRRAHQAAIVAPVVVLGLAIAVALAFFWGACTPVDALWDHRVDRHCRVDSAPAGELAGAFSVVLDFIYAGLPWYVIGGLQMPRRDKMTILLSMSLGVVAGACGIKRAMELKYQTSSNYTKDTVGIIIWHAAELATTLVCIGIPVCRPFYRVLVPANSRHGPCSQNSYVGLATIGGTPFNQHRASRHHTLQRAEAGLGKVDSLNESENNLTGSAARHEVQHAVGRAVPGDVHDSDAASEDAILGFDEGGPEKGRGRVHYQVHQGRGGARGADGMEAGAGPGIRVRTDVDIESKNENNEVILGDMRVKAKCLSIVDLVIMSAMKKQGHVIRELKTTCKMRKYVFEIS